MILGRLTNIVSSILLDMELETIRIGWIS
jgi:hypothetical protein